ncbi:thioredoxin family protein [Sulfurovum sp. ST-21]|uniref:Thioredoxin family protein n=1 Tax=Sulfurovum indicum TaxID=2779528 RepID=A0A7M1S243_9BACT|nr:thioredoxin family protein [Sulfurovum indicum]QOR61487.1 thioredoxin family protein [Sulfurovum indicum]
MRALWLIVLFLMPLFALEEGEKVYEKKCSVCHETYIPMSELKENFLKNNNILKLKAPTLNQLSFRLKQQIGNPRGDEDIHRMEVEAFISEYLKEPDLQKSLCLKDVIQYFDVMPSMKGEISEEEIAAVSKFIYDYDKKSVDEHTVHYENFDKALKRAQKEHKMIMIKATAEHCRYCVKMDREVMVDEKVKRALEKDFIPIEVDVSKEDLPLGLHADMTPTFFFIDQNAKVLKRVPGAWNVEDFLEILNKINQLKGDKK